MYSKDDINKAAQVDIVDYCIESGIPIQSDTDRYYRLIEHDSCVIDRKKNTFYWNSKGINGNTINFVETYYNMNFKDAVKGLLEGDFEKASQVKFVNEPFVYEKENEVEKFDKARDYLINERKINPGLVDLLHEQGLIKQDKRNNVLFLWKDHEKVLGCSEQGTIKSDKFKRRTYKGIQKNSTDKYGFSFQFGEPKHLKFFEASIDALSYASLHRNKMKDTQLISMEGLKPQVVINYIRKAYNSLGYPPESVSLCVDNDKAGRNFIKSLDYVQIQRKDGSMYSFEQELPPVPNKEIEKWDWNNQLQYQLQYPELEQEEEHNKLFLIEYSYLSNASLREVKLDDLIEILHHEISTDANKVSELLETKQINSDFKNTFNTIYKYRYALIDSKDLTEPKILIQFSESELKANEILRFAAGNNRMAEIAKETLNDIKKEYGYLKTRYHVLIPNGEKVEIINPDRLDLGDGFYKSPYEQLINDEKVNDKQNALLLNDMAMYTHEKNGKELIKVNSMLIHGAMDKFMEFGYVNNADYDGVEDSEVRYTVALVKDSGDIELVSGKYDNGDFAFPLHHIDKNNLVDKDTYNKLADAWEKAVLSEEENSMQQIQPQLVKRLHEMER